MSAFDPKRTSVLVLRLFVPAQSGHSNIDPDQRPATAVERKSSISVTLTADEGT
jgi:hypothetical protein